MSENRDSIVNSKKGLSRREFLKRAFSAGALLLPESDLVPIELATKSPRIENDELQLENNYVEYPELLSWDEWKDLTWQEKELYFNNLPPEIFPIGTRDLINNAINAGADTQRVTFVSDSRLDDPIRYPYNFSDTDSEYIESSQENLYEDIMSAQQHFGAYFQDVHESAASHSGFNSAMLIYDSITVTKEIKDLQPDGQRNNSPMIAEYERTDLKSPLISMFLFGRNDWVAGKIEDLDYYSENMTTALHETLIRNIIPVLILAPELEFKKYAIEQAEHGDTLYNFQLDYDYKFLIHARERNIPVLNLWNSMRKINETYGLGNLTGHFSGTNYEFTPDLYDRGVLDESGRNREFNLQIIKMLLRFKDELE